MDDKQKKFLNRRTRFQRGVEEYYCENNITSPVPKKEKITIITGDLVHLKNGSKLIIPKSDKHEFVVSSNKKDIFYTTKKEIKNDS